MERYLSLESESKEVSDKLREESRPFEDELKMARAILAQSTEEGV